MMCQQSSHGHGAQEQSVKHCHAYITQEMQLCNGTTATRHMLFGSVWPSRPIADCLQPYYLLLLLLLDVTQLSSNVIRQLLTSHLQCSCTSECRQCHACCADKLLMTASMRHLLHQHGSVLPLAEETTACALLPRLHVICHCPA